MTWVWWGLIAFGAVVGVWAELTLPQSISRMPKPISERITTGPYRFMKHPMYLGNTLVLTGLGGLAGGIFNAIAFFMLSETVMREWAGREEGR